MANSKEKPERYIRLPYRMLNSIRWEQLGAYEVKLITDLMLQYNGHNNGMLSPCHTLMKKRGWAKTSLHRAFSTLQHEGFLVVTRQGWKQRGKPTLVAFTWLGIDEPKPGIEYDKGIEPNHRPLSYWCKDRLTWKHKPKAKDPRKGKEAKHDKAA